MHVHQSHSGVPFREPLLLVDITNKGSLSPGAFYHVGVTTYLIICRKAPYLLKVVIMSLTQTQPLTDRAALCRERIELCTDLIKQLRGDLPDGCTLTFGIRKIPIVSFEIEDSESWLMMSFFMGWHKYYSDELKRVTAELVGLTP